MAFLNKDDAMAFTAVKLTTRLLSILTLEWNEAREETFGSFLHDIFWYCLCFAMKVKIARKT